jgi:hypothetical protein
MIVWLPLDTAVTLEASAASTDLPRAGHSAAARADILSFLFGGAAPSILLRNLEVRAILP